MTAVIEARGLTKNYGATRALDDVTFAVDAGRIVGLIGPNGAGKTTALKAILGLTSFSGELQVLGQAFQVQGFDVRHGRGGGEPRHRGQTGTGPDVDKDAVAT